MLMTTTPMLLTAARHEMALPQTLMRTPVSQDVTPRTRSEGKHPQIALLGQGHAVIGNRPAEQRIDTSRTKCIEFTGDIARETQLGLAHNLPPTTVHDDRQLGGLKQR